MANNPHDVEPTTLAIRPDAVTALAIGVLILAGVAGILVVQPSPDESRFYIPAIKSLAEQLPAISIVHYQLPVPPMGLLLQSVTMALFHSLTAVRVLSLMAAIAVGVVTGARSPDVKRKRKLTFVMMVLFFPFFLYGAVSIKQHVLALGFVVVGWHLWLSWRKGDIGWWAPAVVFGMAALTSQFVMAFVFALALYSFLFGGASTLKVRLTRISPFVPPAILLGSLFLLWGGPHPRSDSRWDWVTHSASHHTAAGQVWLILMATGVWIAPAISSFWKRLRWLPLVWLVLLVPVYSSGVFDPQATFYHRAVGPIDSLIAVLAAGRASAASALAAIAISAGLLILVPVPRESKSAGLLLFRLYALCYVGMMMFVPFIYEGYCLTLVVPAYLLLRVELWHSWDKPLPRACQCLVPAAGITYFLLKIV